MTVMPPPADALGLYHTGLVVEDLAATAARYSDLLRLRFASVRDSTMQVRVDGETREAELRVTYSMDGPPYLELIEERSGGVWATDALGLSHVGFWAPSFKSAIDRLVAGGMPARVQDVGDGDRPTRFSYHPGDGGLWVEVVATPFQAQLAAWIEASTFAADGGGTH